jgi:hypothetical protein
MATFQDRIDNMAFRENAAMFQDILDNFRQAVVVPNERLAAADRVYKGSHHGMLFDDDGNVINGKKNSYTVQGPTLAQLEAKRRSKPELETPDPRRVGISVGYMMITNAILDACPDAETKQQSCDYFAG